MGRTLVLSSSSSSKEPRQGKNLTGVHQMEVGECAFQSQWLARDQFPKLASENSYQSIHVGPSLMAGLAPLRQCTANLSLVDLPSRVKANA